MGSEVSSLLFPRGIFAPRALGVGRVADLLESAAERYSGRLLGSDLLYHVVNGCIDGRDPGIRNALEFALTDGARLEDVRDTIDAYNAAGTDSYGFDGSPERFSAQLRAALDEFAAEVEKDREQAEEVGLEILLACVLEHPDEADLEFLGLLDFPAAAKAVRRLVRLRPGALAELWDEGSGRLRSEEFTANAWAVLEQAAEHAADLGYDSVLTVHCLLGLLAESEGLADRVLRRQLPPQVGVARAVEIIAGAFRSPKRVGGASIPRLDRDDVGLGFQDRLRAAQLQAAEWGAEQVDVPHLLASVFADPSERLASVLRAEPLRVDLRLLRNHVRELTLEAGDTASREVPYKLPGHLPPSEDLTWAARNGEIRPARHLDRYFTVLCRALYRTTDHHVLVTGLPGVGCTTVLRELALRAARGEIAFLGRKRFVRVDCRDIAPERSAAVLSGLISSVGGRTDLVLCVDGLGPLLCGPGGVRHNLLLRSALKEGRIRLIGVLSGHDYDDLVSVDHELMDLTTRVEITEPDHATAVDIVRQSADELAARFGVRIEDTAVSRAVILAGDFLPRQRLPSSAVKALHRACENFDYDRTQLDPASDPAQPGTIGAERVVEAVSELSGVPAGQLGGSARESLDYAGVLGQRVVGQPDAIRIVAQELRRIKTGLAAVNSGPASVLMFAGLTGVGKTELAKAVAEVYSASKRLQTYPMENFTEPHSVSAILGAPPGYLGYGSGGRLINELNADPYCVVLLDEVEKAHPEVLRPFLNLFDEGWIVDQRGVKAYADRAIIILTSNAGHEVIADTAGRRTDEEIATAVRERLRGLRSRQGEPVFTPELLARIRHVVVFRPLDQRAMLGICRKVVDARCAYWRAKREKELVVAQEVIRHAAREGHRLNTDAGGTHGGRIIEKMIAELVDGPVLDAAQEHPDAFERCSRIEVGLARTGIGSPVHLLGPESEEAGQ